MLLDALHCKNLSRPPIWIMRQAGRYMPEYRALREKHSFLEMCHTPELAAKVTLLPIKEFGFDAAILFSDILLVGEAFNRKVRFEEGVGPIFDEPLRGPIGEAHVEKLSYVGDAIRLLKSELKVPLLGFAGAPFTVASYLIEGKSSRDLKTTKKWMLNDPKTFHELLSSLADATVKLLKLQIEAGVDAVQIFDSWAHFLGNAQFREFSLAYMKRITEALKGTPVILFCRGSSVFATAMAEAKPAAISLDWNCDVAEIRKQIPHIALQGNLDPDILYAPADVIRREAKRLLTSMQGDPGYIFNLGHGISPDVPMSAVRTLVECVQNG